MTIDDVPCVMNEQVSRNRDLRDDTSLERNRCGCDCQVDQIQQYGCSISRNAPSIHHLTQHGTCVVRCRLRFMVRILPVVSCTRDHCRKGLESCEESCKSGSFNSELAEYMRRVMGSNDCVEDSTEFPQMPLVLQFLCGKLRAATLFCERLCAPQCEEAEEKKEI